ncbi:hypothetical protein [Scleromatobacter humisilvae]|uniref:Uncharacterized protein n=1 Tax=Scleromatobacter humisilvae TaxID=2897159 RepID=A0A9X1YLV7_9BURK|nr:hypothetical protein [Scleromatobacter humisilvae]MCK9688346.1 hypothetical protein [Scleromatobacter humisilvae]
MLFRFTAPILMAGALASCGGGGSGGDGSPAEQPLVTNGRVYPAASGLVLIEYGQSGRELQRSSPTAADGSFQFSRQLMGSRIEALYTTSPDRVQPVYSARLGNVSTIAQLEVTPLTTWYDQLMVGGVSSTDAASDIKNLLATNCPALAAPLDAQYLTGTATLPAPDHDWLLNAASAYMQAARRLGVGPKVDFTGWSSVMDRHGDTLSQLCAFSAAISDPAWAATQADRLRQEANVQTPDAGKLAVAIDGARSQGLSFLALQIQKSEFPTQTVALQAVGATGQELSLGSDLVMAQYQLAQAPAAKAQDLVALAAGPDTGGSADAPVSTRASVALTSTGTIVNALQGSVTVDGTAAASMRLVNDASTDKTVHLALNGQDMADLSGIIQQIVAMPVAYSGEPLYRKAWRYLVAHKRNTQQLAISAFQFQPDLWLRSLGSSYCEAQSAVLYRIWTAMGYQARVYALTGHVTVEVMVDGHWQVFDPYLEAYYTDRHGQIVGVAELAQDPSLITHPQTPLLPLSSWAYSAKVAGIFASTGNNYLGTAYMSTEPEPLDNTVQLPAGGYLEVDSATDVAMDSVEPGSEVPMSTMKLWVPPGYTGMLRLPLLLLGIEGAGNVQLFGRTLDASGAVDPWHGLAALGGLDTAATDPSIHDRLQYFYFNDTSDIGVTEILVNSSGADGLTLTLMANPLYFPTQKQLTVRASAADMDGLRFAPTPTTP